MPAALKDSVDAAVVEETARRFGVVDERFDALGFVQRTAPLLDGLELKPDRADCQRALARWVNVISPRPVRNRAALGGQPPQRRRQDASPIGPQHTGHLGALGVLTLTAEVRSTAIGPQRLVVDFVVHHVSASGATSPKVFKWTTIDLRPGEQRTITKRRLIQQASTRTYRAGVHRVELQIAGQVVAATAFDVLV